MNRLHVCAFLVTILCLGLIADAAAHSRFRYEDAVVADRSELILVGRLMPGTLELIEHPDQESRGRSWEYHATLAVADVVKGSLWRRMLPVIIHYGLEPFVGGKCLQNISSIDLSRGDPDYPEDRIAIMDNAMFNMDPIIGNADENNLWFLRKDCGMKGLKTDDDTFGITDPEDIQPLALKEYFQAYLMDDPEKAVKAYIADHPDTEERAQSFIDHCAVQRIIKTRSPDDIIELLLPYFLKGAVWNGKAEAREYLLSHGGNASELLIPVFEERADKWRCIDIIRFWGQAKFRKAAPMLIGVLADAHRYWASQELEEGWWNSHEDRDLREERRREYSVTYYTACALEAMGDLRARDILEKTLAQWRAIQFDNPQIVEVCQKAIEKMAQHDTAGTEE